MSGLAGRVALVTGAARGIGRAVAIELAEYDVRLALVDRAPLESVLAETRERGVEAVGAQADLRRPGELEVAANAIRDRLGDPGLLVNVAGGVRHAPVLEMRTELFREILDLNLTACFRTIRMFSPAMVRRGSGAIVNIASTSARFVWPNTAHYCAAKAGVVSLTRCVAHELAPSGVRVNAVSPGTIETPAWQGLLDIDEIRRDEEDATALHRIGQPRDVARVVAFLLSDDASHVTGEDVLCDGGYSVTGQIHRGRYRL
jgi:3-oxoacyl-[acyl-carrier protein] reductase